MERSNSDWPFALYRVRKNIVEDVDICACISITTFQLQFQRFRGLAALEFPSHLIEHSSQAHTFNSNPHRFAHVLQLILNDALGLCRAWRTMWLWHFKHLHSIIAQAPHVHSNIWTFCVDHASRNDEHPLTLGTKHLVRKTSYSGSSTSFAHSTRAQCWWTEHRYSTASSFSHHTAGKTFCTDNNRYIVLYMDHIGS